MEEEIKKLLIKYATARIDIMNHGAEDNTVFIVRSNNMDANVLYPPWFNRKDGQGLVIECSSGMIDFEIKCVNDGTLDIMFKGIDCRDKNGNRFPIHIDYTNLKINDKKIIDKNTLVWHDEPYKYTKKVKNGEIIKIYAEWKPFNNWISEYDNNLSNTKKRLDFIEKKVKQIPKLSYTSFGSDALGGKLTYRNWLPVKPSITLLDDIDGYCETIWFTRYLKHKFSDVDFKLNFFGPFGEHNTLTSPMQGKKIFFSFEDINLRSDELLDEMRKKYDVYALDYVDFSMGYDFVDNPKYLRFPYWFISIFRPDITEEDIERLIDKWNSLNYPKTDDVVNVSSHDVWKVRTYVANDVEKFTDIVYGGRWRNNTSELWDKYNNNKQVFISKFKFNLCAENLLDDAYVTEKIFNSISANCVPLYAGGGNYLEPEVLNPKFILRWSDDMSDDNSDVIELFKNLLTDEKSYLEFKDQNPILDTSKKYIINKFKELEKHFERLIYD